MATPSLPLPRSASQRNRLPVLAPPPAAPVRGRRRPAWAVALSEDRLLAAILSIAIVISIVAIVYYGSRGETLAYADARARLNIARRVFDNLQPGFVQLGTVWLPVHMLLLLPLVYFEPLWHTGAAGIVISAVAYVLTTAYLYCTVREATGSRFGAAVAGLIALTNANFIYLQATPMSECLFLFCFTAGFYYLLRWAKERRLAQMVAAGFLLDMSALVRYDGWFAVAVGTLAVGIIAWRRADAGRSARGLMIGFVVIGSYGVALFVLYNWIYFGNPVEFAFSTGAGSAFYDRLSVGVAYATKYNIVHAFMTYLWTAVDNIGGAALFLAAAGLAYACYRFRLSPTGIALYTFTSGFVFNVVSLFLGQSVLHNPHVTQGYSLLNERYGIMALPAVAVFAGVLAGARPPALRVAVLGIALAQALALSVLGQPISLRDPQESNAASPDSKAARDYLKSHYDRGLVLVDFRYSDGDAFYMDLPMSRFLHEGVKVNGNPYRKAVGDFPRIQGTPSQYVRWVYGRIDDPPLRGLRQTADFQQQFICVFGSGNYSVYRLRDVGAVAGAACQ